MAEKLDFEQITERLDAYMSGRVYPSEIATTFNFILFDEFSNKVHTQHAGRLENGKKARARMLKPVFVGQYFVDPKNPTQTRVFCHQGSEACSPIPIARGVIGRAIRTGTDQYVPDVTADKEHVGCDPNMKGCELVLVSWSSDNKVPLGVLDIDLNVKDAFSKQDIASLRKIWDKYGRMIFP
ncbi:hypothetical protein FJZ26_01100 [Candidatus Parvarchaeota archaeon]|nr:hypothetical protein [Candidatus Parvarchaeota archaeon]